MKNAHRSGPFFAEPAFIHWNATVFYDDDVQKNKTDDKKYDNDKKDDTSLDPDISTAL